jgi:hypothetical protein
MTSGSTIRPVTRVPVLAVSAPAVGAIALIRLGFAAIF